MKKNVLKKMLITTLIVLVSTNANIAFAQDCSGFSYSNPSSYSLPHMLCFVAQVINFLLFSSGAVLIGMILIGAYKYATAVGDPKAAEGAKLTLTYAVIGFFSVIGTLVLVNILVLTGGIDSSYSTGNIFFTAQQEICNFFQIITNAGATIPGC